VGLILCAELLLALAYHRLVQRPRIEHMAETAQRYLGLLAGAMAHMDTAARQAYLAQLARQPEPVLLRLQPEAPPPDQPATLLQRLSLERLQQGLGPGQALAWTRSPQPRLWLRTELDGRAWWLGLDVSALGRERGSLLLALMLGAGALAALGATLIQRHLHRPCNSCSAPPSAWPRANFRAPRWRPARPARSQLAASFEQMAQQLESTERERALMLAGLSHDLRTLLAKLRLAAEILQVPGEEDLLRGMVRNIAVADQIIEQFIDFARLGAGEAQALCHAEELVRDVAAGLASPRLHRRPADPACRRCCAARWPCAGRWPMWWKTRSSTARARSSSACSGWPTRAGRARAWPCRCATTDQAFRPISCRPCASPLRGSTVRAAARRVPAWAWPSSSASCAWKAARWSSTRCPTGCRSACCCPRPPRPPPERPGSAARSGSGPGGPAHSRGRYRPLPSGPRTPRESRSPPHASLEPEPGLHPDRARPGGPARHP
jgi:two-component system osmolarity sensor histidine kinase EnvZ